MYTSMFLLTATLIGAAADAPSSWTSFRNGGASQASTETLPLQWTKETNIAWQVELAGYGQSAPVTWHGTVYVTCVEGPQKETCQVMAFAMDSGERLWRAKHPASTTLPSNYSVARAAPTPVVDAHGVYAFFEGGDLVAFDHAGALRWSRSLTDDYGPFDNHHGLGSSPAQTAELVILNIQHRGPSYLIAIDKHTGKTRWKVERKSSMSWSSPLVIPGKGRELVIVSSGGSAEAYDARSGDLVWSLGEMSGNSVPSPVLADGHVMLGAALTDFGDSAQAARSNVCLKLTEQGYDVVWRAKRALCDYASPVVAGDYVYYISRVGVLYCLNRHTGEELYAQRLPGPCWATPICQGDRVYLFGKDGQTTVIKVGDKYEVLATNAAWDLDNPPAPERYVETPGGQGHGEGTSRKPGEPSGFVKLMLTFDKDANDRVDASELPKDYQQHLSRDSNGDGSLDLAELTAMATEFRKRRQEASQGSHDPTLYGVAAANGAIFLRCGTRLYCVREAAR